MASTTNPSTYKPITEHLDEVQQNTGLRTYDVFTNWLDFLVTALSRDDDTYLELVDDLTTRLHDDTDLTRAVLEPVIVLEYVRRFPLCSCSDAEQ